MQFPEQAMTKLNNAAIALGSTAEQLLNMDKQLLKRTITVLNVKKLHKEIHGHDTNFGLRDADSLKMRFTDSEDHQLDSIFLRVQLGHLLNTVGFSKTEGRYFDPCRHCLNAHANSVAGTTQHNINECSFFEQERFRIQEALMQAGLSFQLHDTFTAITNIELIRSTNALSVIKTVITGMHIKFNLEQR